MNTDTKSSTCCEVNSEPDPQSYRGSGLFRVNRDGNIFVYDQSAPPQRNEHYEGERLHTGTSSTTFCQMCNGILPDRMASGTYLDRTVPHDFAACSGPCFLAQYDADEGELDYYDDLDDQEVYLWKTRFHHSDTLDYSTGHCMDSSNYLHPQRRDDRELYSPFSLSFGQSPISHYSPHPSTIRDSPEVVLPLPPRHHHHHPFSQVDDFLPDINAFSSSSPSLTMRSFGSASPAPGNNHFHSERLYSSSRSNTTTPFSFTSPPPSREISTTSPIPSVFTSSPASSYRFSYPVPSFATFSSSSLSSTSSTSSTIPSNTANTANTANTTNTTTSSSNTTAVTPYHCMNNTREEKKGKSTVPATTTPVSATTTPTSTTPDPSFRMGRTAKEGEEVNPNGGQRRGRKRAGRGKANPKKMLTIDPDRILNDSRTTLMIRNIPNR